MYSIQRKVRSAGRTSGSVEITLPPEMQALEGIECRLLLRDGARPEIVIQPDVSIAQVVFAEFWENLRSAFAQIGDIGPFSLADFNVSFLPPRHWRERPPLSYRDALAVYRANQEQFQIDQHGLSSLATFLSVGAAYRLGLQDRFALVFGVIAGYWISGICVGTGTDFEQEAALQLFHGDIDPSLPRPGRLFLDGAWEEAQTGFQRIYAQVRTWQEDPDAYELARRRWWETLTTSLRA